MEQHLRSRINNEKLSNVHLMGFKKDVFRYYGLFDAFLLTSKMEGTPISILEAMASGIPVFTSKVGEIPSIVKDEETGFFLSGTAKDDFNLIKANISNTSVILAAREYVENTHNQKIISAKFMSSIMDVHNHFIRRNDSRLLAGEYI